MKGFVHAKFTLDGALVHAKFSEGSVRGLSRRIAGRGIGASKIRKLVTGLSPDSRIPAFTD